MTYSGIRPVNSCRVLGEYEMPTQGTLVALDTEFVDLEKAEIDVKADGTKEMVRPNKSGLARVSVLRGSGLHEGHPFIDDYINIRDTVVDYVTQFSGIRPGDLDLRTSRHNLVPLKVAYKKLWLLLNLGCVFIGHGLASDFRKINIKIPQEQTVDTQFLFFNPGKNRRLSLRYLAWAIFKEYIQEEQTPTSAGVDDGHDSIEDARMALRLYKKFRQYEEAGTVAQILEEIFREGSKLGFKPPPRNGHPPSTAAATSSTGVPVGAAGMSPNHPSVLSVPVEPSQVPAETTSINSAPTTPRQGFRRSIALTPSNGTFTSPEAGGNGLFLGSSPLQ